MLSRYAKRKIKKLKHKIDELESDLRWSEKTIEIIKKYGKLTKEDIERFIPQYRYDTLLAVVTAPNPLLAALKRKTPKQR
jgi:hypothetical protein